LETVAAINLTGWWTKNDYTQKAPVLRCKQSKIYTKTSKKISIFYFICTLGGLTTEHSGCRYFIGEILILNN
jgi:hypothetical protein